MTVRAILIGAALFSLAVVFSVDVEAQGARYEVRQGDTLFGIANRTRHPNTSTQQMLVAIARANKDALAQGVNVLKPGQVLAIPDAAQVSAISAADARREVASILAAPPPAPIPQPPAASVPPAPTAVIVPRKSLAPDAAARRYEEGLEFERVGNHKDALSAFLDAGENGHGLAQRKLGQIYDLGTPATGRDLQTSLMWYQKARAQGVEIPKQIQRTLPRQ